MTQTTSAGTALVTGAARRIGRAIALGLASDGYDLALHCHHSLEDAESLAEEIRALGRRAVVLTADLADSANIADLVDRADAALGPVTLLINNASVFEGDSARALDPALFARQIAVNLTAPCLLAGRMAERLPKDRKGVIINMIDQRVWRLTPQFISYTLSKSALWTATQTLAQALAPQIRVAAIGPGPTLPSTRQNAADFARQAEALILQRGPSLDEIIAGIRFILASPSYTGQLLALDGGQHLAWETPDVVGVKE